MSEASRKVLARGRAPARAGAKAKRDATLLSGTAALALLIAVPLAAPLAAIDRAEAACTPATSAAAPASNTTVTCSGTTTNQNPEAFAGYGTANESGVTINVQAGASVASTSSVPAAAGISIGDGTINNQGTVTATAGNGSGVFAFGALALDNFGLVQGSDRGVFNEANATITNRASGSIVGGLFGIQTDGDLTVGNAGTIKALNPTIGGETHAALAGTNVNVTDNTGTIEDTSTGSVAIKASDTATVANGTGTITGDASAIQANTVNVTANDGIISSTGTNSHTIDATGDANITNGTGTIGSNAAGSTAINAGGAVTLDNSKSVSGLITGAAFGIHADTVNVTGNIGTIEASAANGHAIDATGDVTVTNGGNTTSGTIQAINTNGIAINAGGTATVTNLTGGRISGTILGVLANGAVNVTNNAGALIEATEPTFISEAIASQTGTVTVQNAGTIRASGLSGTAIFGAVGVNLTNNSGGLITSQQAAIVGSQSVNIVDNAGTISSTNASDTAAISGLAVTVHNSTGTIQAIGSDNATAIAAGTATVSNGTGTITADAVGISAQNVTVTGNDGVISATGTHKGNGARAINVTSDANITNGTGSILATNTGGSAIVAGGTATVSNLAGGTIAANAVAIGGLAVNVTGNDGTISGNVAIHTSGLGDLGNANVVNGTGIIQGTIAAIEATNASATVSNGTGTITAGIAAISSTNVIVTGNRGTISATDATGTAIGAVTLDVTNNAGGTISGGRFGIFGGGSIVNAGTIAGGTASVDFTGTGVNTLTLQPGSVLSGDAVGSPDSTNNRLVFQGFGSADNNFVGFNSLDMSGGGWTLNGNAAVGTATLQNGASLAVGDNGHTGALLTGDVTVSSGASLSGVGTVNGDITVASGGGLAPGFSLGTLNVTGNVTFASASVFAVNATPTEASKLAVTGAATLTGGTVNVLAQNATFAPSTQYTILTATGGLGGTTFSDVTTNLFFLTPSLSYDANDVFLTLQANSKAFSDAAQTRNQKAVAGALDASPSNSSLVSALLTQTLAGVRQAFDALSGEVFGSVQNAQAGGMVFARSAMLGRLRQASYAGTPGGLGALAFGGPELAYASAGAGSSIAVKAAPRAADAPRNLTFWSQGFGGWGRTDSDGDAASLTTRFGGFFSGVDARYGDVLRAGLMAGYVRSDLDVDARGSSAGIDSAQLGAYAGARLGAFNVRGGVSYSFDSIDTSRTVAFPGFFDQARAHFHGNVGQVFGEVGYGMAFNGVAVEPLAGLAYVHLRDGSFLESGGVAALSGSGADENIGYSWLGLRTATVVPLANGTALVPRASLQWQYAFGDVTPVSALAFQSTGTGFSVAGVPIARDTALVEGGIDWRLNAQAKLAASYQGELAAHAQTHAFKGSFSWDF